MHRMLQEVPLHCFLPPRAHVDQGRRDMAIDKARATGQWLNGIVRSRSDDETSKWLTPARWLTDCMVGMSRRTPDSWSGE